MSEARKAVMPIQPVCEVNGVQRFTENRIVRALLDAAPIDMNDLACMSFTNQEREQFAQLIGYSVSGFGSLDYVSEETYSAACKMAEGQGELEARNEHLRNTLDSVKKGMRNAVAELFETHPDNLGEE